MRTVLPLVALFRALAATAGRAALARALPVYVALAIGGAIALGPHGVRPSDVTHAALRSPAGRAALEGAWLLLVAPAARDALAAPQAIFLRASPFRASAFLAIHGAFVLAAQAGWFALWAAGEGALAGAAAAVSMTAVAALVAARPRGAVEIGALAATFAATIATPRPSLWLAAGAPAAALGVARGWSRAPEAARRAPRSVVGGPPAVALALVHLTRLAREDAPVLVRAALASLFGAAVGVAFVHGATDASGAARAGYAIAAATAPLAVLAGATATRALANEARLAALLDATATDRWTRALAAVLAVSAPAAALGALVGAAIGAASAAAPRETLRFVASCSLWGVANGVVALGLASRARVHADPSRIVPAMAVVALAGIVVAGAAGEAGALVAGAIGLAGGATSIARRARGA